MTDIVPVPNWGGVRQLETNEFATGGANGNMNEQATSLAARSELLKQYAALPYESKTGGYALNERVTLANGNIVKSTVPNNTNNPNANMTGWEVQDLIRSNNLGDVPDKVVARTNLGVYSTTQVNTAISNSATPAATELVAGKAKIATTAIAQAGTNDADIITSAKLAQTVLGMGQTRTQLTLVSGTTYTNTSGRLRLVSIYLVNSPSYATLKLGEFSQVNIGASNTGGGGFIQHFRG